jgi:hypothetical protein
MSNFSYILVLSLSSVKNVELSVQPSDDFVSLTIILNEISYPGFILKLLHNVLIVESLIDMVRYNSVNML